MDPLLPPQPEAPHFDATAGAWVLSRYRDVLAAFREPRLVPRGDETRQLRKHQETVEALSSSTLAEWRAQFAALAHDVIEGLPADRPIDVVREFAEPWSLAVAMAVTKVDPAEGERLASLGRRVSDAAAEPEDSVLRSRAEVANAEIERSFENRMMALGAPVFVALSQTLPRLVANGWLALLRHPAELARLRVSPDLMPGAVDELLRYAAIPRTLRREATADVEVGDVRIAKDDVVLLMTASANRDPAQFPDPDRLDLTRPIRGQVSLGAGSHSCVGAPLIRMSIAVATSAFVEKFSTAALTGTIEWRGGSGFRSPASLQIAARGGHSAPNPK